MFHQSIESWELILIDDGSNDDSLKIATQFNTLTNVRVYSQKNRGVSAARNYGASKACADWLIFLDADDEFCISALEEFTSSITLSPKKEVFLAGYKRIREIDSNNSIFIPTNRNHPTALPGTFTISRTVFEKLEGYDIRFTFGENSELFRRIRNLGIEPKLLNFMSLIYYDKAIGGSKNMKNMEYSTRLLLKKHSTYFDVHLHEKRVYLQIIGVCNLRLGNYEQAKNDLREAFLLDFFKFDTLGRYLLAKAPFIARIFYPLADYR